jgi:hypothetical protein
MVAAYLGSTITAAILTENAFLRQTFGAEYAAWQAGTAVPAVERRFSLERAIRNREYRAVVGLLVGALLLLYKALPMLAD